MKISDKVRALLDSDIKDYRVSKDTGIPQPVITRYHNGTSQIDNMPLGTAEKLSKYWDAAMIDVALRNEDNDDERLRTFPKRFAAFGQEMVDEQFAIAKSDEGLPDDEALGETLSILFNDALGDRVDIGRLLTVYAKYLDS